MAIRKDCSSCSCWQGIGHNRAGPSVDLQVCCKLLTTWHLRTSTRRCFFCFVRSMLAMVPLRWEIQLTAKREWKQQVRNSHTNPGCCAHPREASSVAHKQSRTLQPWKFHRMRQRVRHGATLGTHAASSHLTSSAAAHAPTGCPGTSSNEAGKASACAGCPNQAVCASAPKSGADPGNEPWRRPLGATFGQGWLEQLRLSASHSAHQPQGHRTSQ